MSTPLHDIAYVTIIANPLIISPEFIFDSVCSHLNSLFCSLQDADILRASQSEAEATAKAEYEAALAKFTADHKADWVRNVAEKVRLARAEAQRALFTQHVLAARKTALVAAQEEYAAKKAEYEAAVAAERAAKAAREEERRAAQAAAEEEANRRREEREEEERREALASAPIATGTKGSYVPPSRRK